MPRLDRLARLVMGRYSQPEHFARIQGGWIDTSASWNLHFVQAFSPAVKGAVGQLFMVGSQAMLVQLLLSSQTGINSRIAHFDRYAPIFERLIVSQLTDYAELQGCVSGCATTRRPGGRRRTPTSAAAPSPR
ncbi:hypothetical protein NKG94_11095 [Micromonospora sp. M12]